jgi:tetratricopeptide (TPR) repeat protein
MCQTMARAAVWMLIFAVSLAAGTPVAAQPAKTAPARPVDQPKSAADYRTAIVAAYEAGALSKALRLGKAAITAYPDDGALHHRYGVVLSKVSELDLARKHLEIARTKLPDNPGVLVELGWVYAALGNSATANKLAAQASKLAPDDPHVAELRVNLELQERIRSKKPPQLPEGSAAAFVDQFMRRIEGGDLRGALDQDVERATVDRIVRGAGGDAGGNRAEIARGFAKGLRQAWKTFFAKPGNRYEGFDVHPEVEKKGDEYHVVVNVLMRRRLDAAQVEQTRRFSESEEFSKYIDAETLAIIRGLEGADRERFFKRIVGLTTSIFVGVTVVAKKSSGGAWKVSEVFIGDPPVAFSSLPGIYQRAARKGLVKEHRRKGRDLPRRIGYLVGLILGLTIIITVLRRLAG